MIDFNNHIFKKCYLTEDLIEYIKNNYSILLKECVNDVCEDKFISMYEYLCYIQ